MDRAISTSLRWTFQLDEILLVEVSASESLNALITKAKNRNALLSELEQHLERNGVLTAPAYWGKLRFLGFIKGAHVKWAYEQCDAVSPDVDSNVCFVPLEDIMLSCSYWDVRGRRLPIRDGFDPRSPDRA